MALTEESGNMVMPVAPMNGAGYNNGGFGFNGNDGWWIILLFILLGNNGFGNSYRGGMSGAVDNTVQEGFNQAALTTGISNIQSSLTNGFSDVQNALCTGFSQAEISANARQISNLQQAFNAQTAVTNGLNNISTQLAQSSTNNQAGLADLKYTVATENCADRTALNDGIRDILNNQNASVQRILDQMCADKIDAKNERIAELERQLTMANLAQSQTAQTSRLLADNAAQTAALEQYLNPVPIPAYVVQNPNCCGQNYSGCGCSSL